MLKKVITLTTVIAIVGLLSVAAAFASDRQRVRDDDVRASAGLQGMQASQFQLELRAQDPANGEDGLQTQNRAQTRVMVEADCDDPVQDRDRDRIHQDSDTRPGPNGEQDHDGRGPVDAARRQAGQ